MRKKKRERERKKERNCYKSKRQKHTESTHLDNQHSSEERCRNREKNNKMPRQAKRDQPGLWRGVQYFIGIVAGIYRPRQLLL